MVGSDIDPQILTVNNHKGLGSRARGSIEIKVCVYLYRGFGGGSVCQMSDLYNTVSKVAFIDNKEENVFAWSACH